MIKDKLLNLPRASKRAIQVLADILLVWVALWLAFLARIGLDESLAAMRAHWWLLAVAPVISVTIFIPMGMYRTVIRYLGKEALLTIFKSITMSALTLALVLYWQQVGDAPTVPRSFVLNYWLFSLAILGGLRLLVRYYLTGNLREAGEAFVPFLRSHSRLPKVAIYGAGSAGNQLLAALRLGKLMRPVAFIDDDESLSRRTIAGLKVYHASQIERMVRETNATEILLAIPSAGRQRRREILSYLERYPLHVRTVPGFMDLASGRVQVQDIRDVDIVDLLGRDPVAAHRDLFDRCIKGKNVLVTGAGGSIGSELCRQILASGAITLVLYEHSEFNLYHIHKELEARIKKEGLAIQLIPILASIRNKKRIGDVLQIWKIETIYHAAAYKHVPMVEFNSVEGIHNNAMGTLFVAQAAIRYGVANFVLVSTDKAVRPTNVMGATKRLAEMILQALSREKSLSFFGSDEEHENKTRFTMVRFGNVLGSSGSVIPLFREQIKNGGPVTVTHPNITRYFMTIPEAAELVIQAGSMGEGGDVFVLDMGDPVKIAELAEKMILLTGLTVRNEENPKGDIEIVFTGLRPGEKLYEELLLGDNTHKTEHPKILRANEALLPWQELKERLTQIQKTVEKTDCVALRAALSETVDGYVPQGDLVDLIYTERLAQQKK